jgi:4-amino-4-deoxychorismate lyase
MNAPALIETLLLTADGELPLLQGHLRRLALSAQALEYPVPHDLEAQLRQAAAGRAGAQRVRLLLQADGAIDLVVVPLAPLAAGQRVRWSPIVLDAAEPWLQHKSTRRPWYEEATAWLAQHPTVFDLLFCNQHGEVCEGSRSNVYALIDGEWFTPPLDSGCLGGVARASLIDSGQARTAKLTASDLRAAAALRLSNALRGWIDVELEEDETEKAGTEPAS